MLHACPPSIASSEIKWQNCKIKEKSQAWQFSASLSSLKGKVLVLCRGFHGVFLISSEKSLEPNSHKGSRQPPIYKFSLLSRKCLFPGWPSTCQVTSSHLALNPLFQFECPCSNFSKRKNSNHYRAPKSIGILQGESSLKKWKKASLINGSLFLKSL